jgi:hypothetical protein
MNNPRVATPGKTRVCPHCKSTILESATICPSCQHHLKFGAATSPFERRLQPAFSALRVEGAFRQPDVGVACEYSIVIAIRNDRGEEITRRVIDVGALQPREGRTVMLSVDVFTPSNVTPIK